MKSFQEFTDQKEAVSQPIAPPPQDNQMSASQDARFQKGLRQAVGASTVNVKDAFAQRLGWAMSKLARTYLRTMGEQKFMQQVIAATRSIIDNPDIASGNFDGGRVNMNVQKQEQP